MDTGRTIRRLVRGLLLAALVLVSLQAADTASADSRHRHRGELGEDEIRDAIRRKEIRPYEEVLPVALKAMPGQVASVRVRRRNDRLLYEFKIIAPDGRLREIYIDGATLEVVRVE